MLGMSREERRQWVVEERRQDHVNIREARARLAETLVKLEQEEAWDPVEPQSKVSPNNHYMTLKITNYLSQDEGDMGATVWVENPYYVGE